MHYLALALYAEGPTDHRFLSKVLYRSTYRLCATLGQSAVEVKEEVLDLDAPHEFRQGSRDTRILEAARAAIDTFNIQFVHSDGAGDPESARDRNIQPAVNLISQELPCTEIGTVPVVPVRETEAWVLADGAALRDAFGTSLGDDRLGVPIRARQVERITDPKQALEEAFTATLAGRRRRQTKKAGRYLEIIGERVRLERLQEIPAFQQFECDLTTALQCLGYIR